MVVKVDSMAVIVFWAISATSTTGICAWATGVQSTTSKRLRLSCFNIVSSFLHRHTLTMHEFVLATIDAVKRAQLPLGHVHTATEEQTETEDDDAPGTKPIAPCTCSDACAH